jgi:NodT family efflux transporter outer membrane factor (OMF) lipoprotein
MIALLAGAADVGACGAGPAYVRPPVAVPAEYKERGGELTEQWREAMPNDTTSRGKWWQVYGDVRLNALEERLDVSNQNIVSAVAQVQIARAMIREAAANAAPTVTTSPSIIGAHISTGFGRQIGTTFPEYSLPVNASWEPDLWARVRQSVQASTFAAQAVSADLENVRLSAQAELATDYFSLRGQDALRAVLDSAVRVDSETVGLTRVLRIAGRSSDEAVDEAQAQLNAAQAQATNLGVLRAQYEHAIAVLIGQPPATFSIAAEPEAWRLPRIPTAVPSALLERRPDIAAAERTVAEANTQIGIARTAYYPTLTLDGSAGVLSTTLTNLFTWPSRVWSLGPTLIQTIFDGGLRNATVRQYQAAYDQSVAGYRQTVLTAFQQVEDNLAAVRLLGDVIVQQDSAVDAQRRATREAEVRYRAGLDPYLNVTVAQTTLLGYEQTAVTLRMQQTLASVQLIKALGGAWR